MATLVANFVRPEPIPLRTLTTLLNYERMISDPRYQNVRLSKASIADPNDMLAFLKKNPAGHANLPTSVKTHNTYFFDHFVENTIPTHPSTICEIHPKANALVKALTFEQRELIYYQTRAQGGCYMAVGLFDFFFQICPLGQQISIQLKDEEPILLDPGKHWAFNAFMKEPKQSMISCTRGDQIEHNLRIANCTTEGERHMYLVFDTSKLGALSAGNPFGSDNIVVDMTYMQFAQKGLHGENYFIGRTRDYIRAFHEGIAGVRTDFVPGGFENSDTEGANAKRMMACAEKVWKRWQDRATEGWCEFCGKGGKDLMLCSAYKTEDIQVRCCCREHQVSGWKLHKFTCKKAKK